MIFRSVFCSLMAAKQSPCKRHPSAVFLIDYQPQLQLIELGTEERVHVLRAEGLLAFREAASSRPGGRRTCLSNPNERLLCFSDLAGIHELQKSFHAPRAVPALGAIPATERHLEYGLQPAETRETNDNQ